MLCLLFYRRKGIAVSMWVGMTHTLRIPADRYTKNTEEEQNLAMDVRFHLHCPEKILFYFLMIHNYTY